MEISNTPNVFISPSVQEYNYFSGGGTEEYYMNLIADELVPMLMEKGYFVERNNPDDSLAEVIQQSNNAKRDIHLAIHSNAGGGEYAERSQGVEIYYYPYSEQGKRAAEIIARNYKEIYPNPNAVKLIPTTTLAEITKTRSPAVLIEVGFHDNPEEAEWIRENIENIASSLADSISELLTENS